MCSSPVTSVISYTYTTTTTTTITTTIKIICKPLHKEWHRFLASPLSASLLTNLYKNQVTF